MRSKATKPPELRRFVKNKSNKIFAACNIFRNFFAHFPAFCPNGAFPRPPALSSPARLRYRKQLPPRGHNENLLMSAAIAPLSRVAIPAAACGGLRPAGLRKREAAARTVSKKPQFTTWGAAGARLLPALPAACSIIREPADAAPRTARYLFRRRECRLRIIPLCRRGKVVFDVFCVRTGPARGKRVRKNLSGAARGGRGLL